MKILKQDIKPKTRDGYAVLLPEEPEDMWHIYNIVREGDDVRAPTFRKVVKEMKNGDKISERKRLKLKIQVETIDFDPDKCELRLNGRNIVGLAQHPNIEK